MGRLIWFELQKAWCKRSFQFAAGVMLILNIFFLWYTNLGNERTPELSSYKAFAADIEGMSEAEKDTLLKNLKQTIDGVSFVEQILFMQNSEIGASFAAQEMAENPGVFEAYYDLYLSGNYLRYTDSLELESIFINEMYAEESKVADYGSYLCSVQEKKASLNGISILNHKTKTALPLGTFKKAQKITGNYLLTGSNGCLLKRSCQQWKMCGRMCF